jgi:hypothetical protein
LTFREKWATHLEITCSNSHIHIFQQFTYSSNKQQQSSSSKAPASAKQQQQQSSSSSAHISSSKEASAEHLNRNLQI